MSGLRPWRILERRRGSDVLRSPVLDMCLTVRATVPALAFADLKYALAAYMVTFYFADWRFE